MATPSIKELDSSNTFMSLEEALKQGTNKEEANKDLNSTSIKEKIIQDKINKKEDLNEDVKLQPIENKSGEYFIDGVVDVSKSFTFDELDSLSKIDKNKIDEKENYTQIGGEESTIKSNENRFSITDFRVVGSILNTYIILEKNNSMYLLDQHAAHEKVLYEEYMKKFKNHKIDMQMLLDPIVLEISNIDMLKVESNLDLFLNFGFEIELFGNNHICISI